TPKPRAIAAEKAPGEFSGRLAPCSPRWAKTVPTSQATLSGAGAGASQSSIGANGDNRIDLYRGTERQDRNSDRTAGMLAGIAEHGGHQLRRTVGHLGLIGEVRGRADEGAQLHHPL